MEAKNSWPLYIATNLKVPMRSQPNYQDLFQRVNLYLDNELEPEAEHALLAELKDNKAYYDVLSQEQSFRDFLKARLQRRKASPELIQSIKDKIRIAPV